ncbi:LPXTG cell wall anchor domain-containing protein [Lacticaseibacillus porcinae]|uniref:LPXTG cell wall anchor domain-containing protein n=1 Tax=Lacticaseibacillus porcinae TaxID=1123687 RepID=UPI000F7A0A37|nr:LPXTG cell wall anchor domain-containing protein [Lacticaseibacillus porcinae]
MKTHMTITVTGDPPQVAKGEILARPHPNLPATGNQRSMPLVFAGVMMLALILVKSSKRHGWWVLLLVLSLTGGKPVQAAELPEILYPQVSLWDVPPAKATPPYNWLLNSGFTPPTPDNAYLTTTVNTPQDLTAYYSRPVFLDTFKSMDVTLTIWQVAPYVGGRYQAKRVYTKTIPKAVPFGVWSFTIPFSYTPTTPGTYFFQYTTNTPMSLTNSALVASDISRLLVKQPTKTLSIQAPKVVFPSTGSPAYQATTQTTPIDATDRINWTASQNVNLAHTSGVSVGFHGQASQQVNWDPARPGLSAALGATAGKAKATHDFHIGGLAAVDTNADAIALKPLIHSTQGLTETAKQLPAGRWKYDWTITPTKQTPKGLQLDLPNQKSMRNFTGVNNASGYIDDLSDAAVAFEIQGTGSLIKTLMQATAAGTPYAIKLDLIMENSQQAYTLVSNYAGITIAKPSVMLSVNAPDKLNWEFTRLELFDRKVNKPLDPVNIAVIDHYDVANWQLSVNLGATPSKKDFPFAILINDQRLDYDAPAAVIQTGRTEVETPPIDLRLQPTEDATTSLDSHWRAEITWTLTHTVEAGSL